MLHVDWNRMGEFVPSLPHIDQSKPFFREKEVIADIVTSTVTNSNATVDLEYFLGPKRLPLTTVIPTTVIYSVILVAGIIGNVSTCIVIAHNRYMHTATNYYLFNLAIADLLVLVLGIPVETYTMWSAYPWIFGETFCVLRSMASETSTYASILTITAFTVERYVAICHPMRAHTVSSLKRAVKIIVTLWIVSSLCAVPIILQYGVVFVSDANGNDIMESASCRMNERQMKHAFGVSTFLFFLAPMTVITVLYILIGLAIRKSALTRAGSDTSHPQQERCNGNDLRAQQQANARRAVLNMLVAVVVTFFICWAPFNLQRLLIMFSSGLQQSKLLDIIQHVLFYISGILYYMSPVINPILYNIMSLKFRQAFKTTLLKPCCRKRPVHAPRTLHRTYRFNSKLIGGTATTQLQLQANGCCIKHKTPAQGTCKFGRKSESGGSRASDGRPPLNGPAVNDFGDRPFSSQEKHENISLHSCHHSSSSSSQRPRHGQTFT